MQDNTQNKPYASLLYWRRSWWNGLACKPSVLKIDENDIVSLKDYDGNNQFSVPARQIKVRFTKWGTMLLTANGVTYDIIGSGASISPDPQAGQMQEIAEINGLDQKDSSLLTKLGSAGAAMSAAAPAAGVAGTAAMTVAYYRGVDAMKTWQKIFIDRGSQVDSSTMQGLKTFVKYSLLTIFSLVALVALYGILR